MAAASASSKEMRSVRPPPPQVVAAQLKHPQAAFQEHMRCAVGMASDHEKRKTSTEMDVRTSLMAPLTHGVAPRTLDGLLPMTLKEAAQETNKIHIGRMVLVTCSAEAYRDLATNVLVTDAEGSSCALWLNNFVRDDEDPTTVFPKGTRIAIMEPYMRFPNEDPQNPVGLHCDNPQQIRFVSPEPSRAPPPTLGPTLELSEDPRDSRREQAALELLVGWPQRPNEALAALGDAGASPVRAAVERALREQEAGDYDQSALLRETAQGTLPVPRWHCEFESPDIALVDASSGACSGQGFVATRSIPAGTLVMASRAFVRRFPRRREVRRTVIAATNRLMKTESCAAGVIHELAARPERSRELYALDAGEPYADEPPPARDGAVDVARIRDIAMINSFGGRQGGTCAAEATMVKLFRFTKKTARYERDSVKLQALRSEIGGLDGDDDEDLGNGLWTRASLFNNSCLANLTYHVLGDFFLAWTTRDVQPGTELCISYIDVTAPFDNRELRFSHWSTQAGFVCLCARCAASRDCGPQLVALEADAAKLVAAGQRSPRPRTLVRDARKLRAKLEKLPKLVAIGALVKVLKVETTEPNLALSERLAELTRDLHGCGTFPALSAYIDLALGAMGVGAFDNASVAMQEVITWACVRPWPSAQLSLPQLIDVVGYHSAVKGCDPNLLQGVRLLVSDLAKKRPDGLRIDLKEPPYCAFCLEENGGAKLMTCSRCSREKYCSREHQKKHWKFHKISCKSATATVATTGTSASPPPFQFFGWN